VAPLAPISTTAFEFFSADPRLGAEMNRMVRSLAGRLHSCLPHGCGIEMADLMQAGNVGLLEALRTFEPGRGTPLAAYAKFRIRGEMLDMVRRNIEQEDAGIVIHVASLEGAAFPDRQRDTNLAQREVPRITRPSRRVRPQFLASSRRPRYNRTRIKGA